MIQFLATFGLIHTEGPSHLRRDTATLPSPRAAVNDAVDWRLDTNEPSRRVGTVEKLARAAAVGAVTKAWLRTSAERARRNVHRKYRIVTVETSKLLSGSLLSRCVNQRQTVDSWAARGQNVS